MYREYQKIEGQDGRELEVSTGDFVYTTDLDRQGRWFQVSSFTHNGLWVTDEFFDANSDEDREGYGNSLSFESVVYVEPFESGVWSEEEGAIVDEETGEEVLSR